MKKAFARAASVTSDADTPGHYLYSTVARRRDCLRVSVRVDWIEVLITSESSLLARLLNVTCVFGEIDAFASRWFAKNLAFAKLDALGSEIISCV